MQSLFWVTLTHLTHEQNQGNDHLETVGSKSKVGWLFGWFGVQVRLEGERNIGVYVIVKGGPRSEQFLVC